MAGTNDLSKRISSKNATVAIIGFGYIGSCVGVMLAKNNFKVIAIDKDENVINEVNNGVSSRINDPGFPELLQSAVNNGLLYASSDYSLIQEADIVIVTVGTPLDDHAEPDLSQLEDCCNKMAAYLSVEQLVIIKSTVPPTTTERFVKPQLFGNAAKEKVLLSFCPERVAQGNAISELQTLPVLIGGINKESADLSSLFFEVALGVDTIILDDPTSAELAKLADNLWIDLNIAMSNELAIIADHFEVDVIEVIKAANTLPKGQGFVNILTPSIGVGGPCLTKDPFFLTSLNKEMETSVVTPSISRKVNQNMPGYCALQIEKALRQQDKKPEESKIAILGITYKSDSNDCRNTPAIDLIQTLVSKGAVIEIFDPIITKNQAKEVTDIPLSDSLENVLKNADCVAFLAGHKQFLSITIDQLKNLIKPGAIIYDGRRYFTKDEIQQIKDAGFLFKGVGRS